MLLLEKRIVLDAAGALLAEDLGSELVAHKAGGLDLANNAELRVEEGSEQQIDAAALSSGGLRPPESIVYSVISPPSHGSLLLSGVATNSFTQADINNGLLSYLHSGNESSGVDGFNFSVTDDLSGQDSGRFDIEIVAVNDERPDVDLNGADLGRGFITEFTENSDPVAIVNTGEVQISDADSNASHLQGMTIRLTNNLNGSDEFIGVDVGASGIDAELSYSNGEALLTLSNVASIDAYQAVLNSLQYGNSAEDLNPEARIIQVTAFDGANSSEVSTILINMRPENDAPVWAHPASQVAVEETPTQLAGISLSDVDVGDGELTVTLAVQHGSLNLPDNVGLALVSGNSSDSVIISGNLEAINAALAGLSYTSEQDFNGLDELNLSVDDQGNSGGDPKTADSLMVIDLSNVSISSVNDAPQIQAPDLLQAFEDSPLSVTGLSVSDVDIGNGQMQVELIASHGSLSLPQNAGITFSQGNAESASIMVFEGGVEDVNAALASLVFNPEPNYNGAANISITANDQSVIQPQSLSDSHSLAINVHGVNDAPSLLINQTLEIEAASVPLVIDDQLLAASDIDHSNDELMFELLSLPTHGELTLNGRPLAAGEEFSQQDINNDALAYRPFNDGASEDAFQFQLRDPETISAQTSGGQTFKIEYPDPVETPDRYRVADDLFGSAAANKPSAQPAAPLPVPALTIEPSDYLSNSVEGLAQSLSEMEQLQRLQAAADINLEFDAVAADGIIRSCSEVAASGACNLDASDNPASRLDNVQPELLGRYYESGPLHFDPKQLTDNRLLQPASDCDHLQQPPQQFADDYMQQAVEACISSSPADKPAA